MSCIFQTIGNPASPHVLPCAISCQVLFAFPLTSCFLSLSPSPCHPPHALTTACLLAFSGAGLPFLVASHCGRNGRLGGHSGHALPGWRLRQAHHSPLPGHMPHPTSTAFLSCDIYHPPLHSSAVLCDDPQGLPSPLPCQTDFCSFFEPTHLPPFPGSLPSPTLLRLALGQAPSALAYWPLC